MKKSIKYAGIAAATLLAVAPVAAPVFVQAADTINVDQGTINTEVQNFSDQFGDQDAKDVTIPTDNTKLALGENNAQSLSAWQGNNNTKGLIKTDNTSKLTNLVSEDRDAKVYVVATDAKNNTYDGSELGKNASDLSTALTLDSYLPVTFTVYLKYKTNTTSYTGWQKAATFKLNASDDDDITSLNATFTTPLNVALNSKVVATQLINGSNVSLKDQNGDSIATQNVELGKTYYHNYSQAMDHAADASKTTGDVTYNDDGTTGNTDVINSDGEFAKAGTYYQTVTYTAQTGSALDSLITAASTNPSKYTITVNGKKASAGYDFVATKATDSAPATITFVRAINVADSDAEWTVSSVDGVVTTKSDSAYYTLKNNDNNTVQNRALAKNTAWKTDKKRVDQNGNVQYRVATGEWVNANDVTFSEAGSTTNTGALTDIQKVTGTVSLEDANHVYFLYNKDGEQVQNRALAGNSAWKVINTAKDANGNTMYRVATNEWVMAGTGVSFN